MLEEDPETRTDFPNVDLICRIYSGPAEYLELVFVAVEKMDLRYLNDIFVHGRVNELSYIIIVGSKGEEMVRAAVLLYRFFDLNCEDAQHYFRTGHSSRVSKF